MYRKKEDLRIMIESLNNGEKRHFTNMYRPLAGERLPMFLELYELLENGQSEIPNDLFSTSNQSLVNAKRHLYASILKSLRILHDSSSIDIGLQNQLSEIEILYTHRLPDQASLILKKAYGSAKQYEKYAHLQLILEWEKKLNVVLDQPTRPTIEIIDEQNQITLMAQQLNRLESLYSHILLLKRKYGYVKGEMAGLVKRETILSKEMVTEKDCYGEKSIYYRNFIFAIYHWMTFDHQKAHSYSKKLILTEQHSILPGDYLAGIFQHITSSICAGLFEDTMIAIKIAEMYSSTNHLDIAANYKTMLFAHKATYQIKVLMYRGEFKELKKCIRRIERELGEYQSTLRPEQQHIVLGNMMNGYMALGEYGKAEKIWNELFDQQKTMRKDIFADLFIFRLFILLHTKSYQQVSVAAQAAQRYFKRMDQVGSTSTVEMEMARLFARNSDLKLKQERNKTLEAAKAIVTGFIQQTNPHAPFQEHYSRYAIWCEAIIANEPFYQAAEKWHARFKDTALKKIKKRLIPA
jgi:hypothetical protein